MSEEHKDPTTSVTEGESNADGGATQNPQLADLMSQGAARPAAAKKPAVDLDGEALQAAERALADGQKALAKAQEEIAQATAAPRGNRVRELVLRLLLVGNVVAMIIVAMLPPGSGSQSSAPAESEHVTETGHGTGTTPVPHGTTSQISDPWNLALVAAERSEWASAIEILEKYLADSPRMAPSQRLSVLMALSYYSSRIGNFTASQEYQRKAEAIEQSHSLPEDLVAMAKAAAENGDQESLRRIWARFLLQQRQVPTWLYKHVAQAYLQLGDSYRLEANQAAEQERVRQLEESAAALRAERFGKQGGK